MTTFDQILPIVTEVLAAHHDTLAPLEWLILNRDLNGRVRLIVPEQTRENEVQRAGIEAIYQALAERLVPHAYAASMGVLYEATQEDAQQGASSYPLNGFDRVWVVDRLTTEANCDDPVARTYALGEALAFEGTPAIYTEDGKQLGGFVPPEEMAARLDKEEPQGSAKSEKVASK